eukprot:4512142-Prymnesium_polylepis.2
MGTSRRRAVQISNSAIGSVTSAFDSTTTTASLLSIHSTVDGPPPIAHPRSSLAQSSDRSTRAWLMASDLEQQTKIALSRFVIVSGIGVFNRLPTLLTDLPSREQGDMLEPLELSPSACFLASCRRPPARSDCSSKSDVWRHLVAPPPIDCDVRDVHDPLNAQNRRECLECFLRERLLVLDSTHLIWRFVL